MYKLKVLDRPNQAEEFIELPELPFCVEVRLNNIKRYMVSKLCLESKIIMTNLDDGFSFSSQAEKDILDNLNRGSYVLKKATVMFE
ncbi:MAG TPA: hypothetical protein GX708_17620 [Gallicola sp.]|nr:hypothetical protein [Gallicola sp.]